MGSQERSRRFAPPETEPHYVPPRTWDVEHLALQLDIDPRRRQLQGRATLTLAPITATRDLDLDLATTLQVQDVRVVDGATLEFEHDDDRLHVRLPRRMRPGQSTAIQIDYGGTPRRGLFFIPASAGAPAQVWSQGQDVDAHHWFPCFDRPDVKSTSSLEITAPREFHVISNGRLVEVRAAARGRKRTWHWHEAHPHPPYLVSVALGVFEELRHPAAAVEVRSVVPPGDRAAARRTFAGTAAMLDLFAARFGVPYPFEKYAQTVVRDFVFGGMENISATTLTDAVLLDAVAARETHSDDLIAHELAHQWFGNLVTCKEWAHAWLNEGFATYCECVWAEEARGHDEFVWMLGRLAASYFDEDAQRYRRALVERRWRKPLEIFDRHLYEKGGYVVHMLRRELGDATFWACLQHYLEQHRHGAVETADLKIAIEQRSGRHLDRFFDQWVLAPGYPELRVETRWNRARRQLLVDARQIQSGEDGTPAVFVFDLTLELGTARGPQRRRVRVAQREQRWVLDAPARPLWVRVDPDRDVLMRLQHELSRDAALRLLQAAPDAAAVETAAAALARYAGDRDVRRHLETALKHTSFHAARGALARALVAVAGAEATPLLLRAARAGTPRARRRIVAALSRLQGDPRVRRELAARYGRERSYMVRAEVLVTLAALQAPGVYERCRRALDTPSYRDQIACAALRGLARLEDERAIDRCLEHTGRERSRWRREAAMEALATLAHRHPHRARAIREHLEAILAERGLFGELAAARALARLGRPEALGALQRLAREHEDARVQRAAQEAAARLREGGHPPRPLLALREEVQGLREENRTLRERLEDLESRLVAAERALRRRAAARGVRKRRRS